MNPSSELSFCRFGFNAASHEWRNVLQWVENGDLELSLAEPKSFFIIQLKGPNVRDPSRSSFVIKMKNPKNLKTVDLMVQLDYPANDELQRNGTCDGPRIPKGSERIFMNIPFFFGKCITMVSVIIIGILFHSIGVIIRIVIEARLGWSNLNAVGKAATITFALEASWIFYLIIPPPIAQTLFIISRLQKEERLKSLEIAWVVVSVIGNPWIGAFFGNIVLFSVNWLCLKIWRISFQPEWPDNGGLAWKVYLWVSRIYATIRLWLISMEILD
ncbi:hypothetical protein FACUT_13698, partial [Fusarium acutatum]